jgi:hypothetical protein
MSSRLRLDGGKTSSSSSVAGVDVVTREDGRPDCGASAARAVRSKMRNMFGICLLKSATCAKA